MKQLYLLVFFFISTLSFGQENRSTGDIEGLKIFPNPVINGKVFITTPLNSSKKVLIFDVLGTQVLETTVSGSELNLSYLDAGIYVIRIFEKDKMATRKLIIK